MPDVNIQVNMPGQPGTIAMKLPDPKVTVTETHSQTTVTTTGGTTSKNSEQFKQRMQQNPPAQGNANSKTCSSPMQAGAFEKALNSIKDISFEESKLTQAKTIARNNCFSTDQIKGIMDVFGFEESKLTFAKFAYNRCTEKGSYYLLNEAFSFTASKDELNKYISEAGE